MIAPAIVQKDTPVLGRRGVVAAENRPAAQGEPWDGSCRSPEGDAPTIRPSRRGTISSIRMPPGTLPRLRRDGENALPSLPHSSA